MTMAKLKIKSDLYDALFPIYYISKGVGLLPVRFTRQINGKYLGRIHLIDIIYSICLLLLFILAEVWGLWRDLRNGWVNSTRLKHHASLIATIGDVVAVALLASVGVLGAPFRWKYIQEIIYKFVQADEKLGYILLKKTRRFAIILLITTVGYFIALVSLDFYTWDKLTKKNNKMSDKGPINYLPIYFLYLQGILIEIQYTIATYNLNERFLRLNKNLGNLLKKDNLKEYLRQDIRNPDPDDQDVFSIKEEIENKLSDRVFTRTPKLVDCQDGVISNLITVHSNLCDTNGLINKAFGVPILVIAITCLLHLIITPYFLMMEANSDQETLFICVQCLWCVFHIFRMLIVVQPSYATTTESKYTAILVSQLLTYNWQTDTRKQLEIFSLQILHRPLAFSACGLFSLDRALVTSMAGAVTTYLVILIQFQKADDTKDTNNMLKNATLLLKNVSTFH